MKSYNLSSFPEGSTYFLSLHDPKEISDPILVICHVEELEPHAYYKLTMIKPHNGENISAMIRGSELSTDNLSLIAYNFHANLPDIMDNIKDNDTQ